MENFKSSNYPSTTALRCFDASAKFMSFTKAAQALNMTQSAVSKQISNLEETLNTILFERSRSVQALKLTPAGELFLIETQKILNQIEISVLNLLTSNSENQTLHIATHPSFCARILVPALKDFNKIYPHIHLDIQEQISSSEIDRSQIEVAFLYGDGVWRDMTSIKLFDEECIVVASPELIAKPFDSLQQFSQYSLLQLRSRPRDWTNYFQLQESELDKALLGPRIDTIHSCIQAALLGSGLALVPKFYVKMALMKGELIQVWPYSLKSTQAYYMVYPTSMSQTQKISIIVNWIDRYFKMYKDL